jgi:hypothetical protein
VTDAKIHRLPLVTFLFQPQVLTLWGFATLLTWILFLAPQEGLFFFATLMLYLTFAVFFFSYGFDVIENTALGHAKAPSFSNSFTGSRKRLVRQVFILALGFTLIEIIPEPLQWIAISMLLAVAPAISSSIVFHQPIGSALNPLRIWQFISNMGFGYMALRLLTTSVLLLCLYVASGELDLSATREGKALVSGGAVMLVLMMFRATGTLLHIRREELGIKTEFSAEQNERQARRRERKIASVFLDKVKREFKLNGTESSYRMLELELKRYKFRDDAIFYELLKDMADRLLLYRFAAGYVGRLIEVETSRAWAILLEMHREARGGFQLRSGSDLLRLMKTAETREERLVLLEMMENFEQDFPQHPEVKGAWLSAAELALLVNDKGRARSHISRAKSAPGKIDEARLERARLQLEG